MAYNTTETRVRLIMLKINAAMTDLEEYIIAANSIVTSKCSSLSPTQAGTVETWLAAHFVAMVDERIASEGVEGLSRSFQKRIDLNLNQTKYGQTAMALDTSGGLAAWNKSVVSGTAGQTRGFWWAGNASTD